MDEQIKEIIKNSQELSFLIGLSIGGIAILLNQIREGSVNLEQIYVTLNDILEKNIKHIDRIYYSNKKERNDE